MRRVAAPMVMPPCLNLSILTRFDELMNEIAAPNIAGAGANRGLALLPPATVTSTCGVTSTPRTLPHCFNVVLSYVCILVQFWFYNYLLVCLYIILTRRPTISCTEWLNQIICCFILFSKLLDYNNLNTHKIQHPCSARGLAPHPHPHHQHSARPAVTDSFPHSKPSLILIRINLAHDTFRGDL